VNLILASSVNDQIRQAIADIAEALLYPVLIAAIITLLIVAYELGRLGVEAWKRSQRPKTPFEQTAQQAMQLARAGDSAGAQAVLKSYSYGDHLQKALVGTTFAQNALDAQRAVIEYDLYVSKRLDRVRLLVRAGPALGLMGTLIPLAPALAALGKGQPSVLADELQTAFAVTVVGVLVGLVAFTIALIRERYFTRDLTDLEYLRELRGDPAPILAPATVAQPSAATPAHKAATDQPEAASAALADTVVAPATTSTPATTPTPATTSTPAAPAPAAAAAPPAAPVPPSPVPPAPAPVPAAPAFPPPPAEQPKKKFGLKKKTPKAAPAPPAFPPPPPPPTVPPAGADPAAGDGGTTDGGRDA
jgi:biopolymer transport protein ExbB/TolQ